MSEVVSVIINNKKFTGWETIYISSSLDAAAQTFDIGLLNTHETHEIIPGQLCKILIDDETVLTGYIGRRGRKISTSEKSMFITGRDKIGDLIDCSIEKKSGTWRNVTILDIASEICKPFGISVSMGKHASPGDKFIKFSLQDGETAFSLIERLCRQRSLLPISTPEGNLLLDVPRSTYADDALVYGSNIKVIDELIDYDVRFSTYTVKSQNDGGGDSWSASTVTGLKGTSKDKALSRYRPLVMHSESKGSLASLKKRAAWEAVVRFGRSLSYTIVTPTWKQTSRALWKRNMLVDLICEDLSLDGTFIISGVTYTLTPAEGHNTTLTLRHQDAYTPNPSGEIAP